MYYWSWLKNRVVCSVINEWRVTLFLFLPFSLSLSLWGEVWRERRKKLAQVLTDVTATPVTASKFRDNDREKFNASTVNCCCSCCCSCCCCCCCCFCWYYYCFLCGWCYCWWEYIFFPHSRSFFCVRINVYAETSGEWREWESGSERGRERETVTARLSQERRRETCVLSSVFSCLHHSRKSIEMALKDAVCGHFLVSHGSCGYFIHFIVRGSLSPCLIVERRCIFLWERTRGQEGKEKISRQIVSTKQSVS